MWRSMGMDMDDYYDYDNIMTSGVILFLRRSSVEAMNQPSLGYEAPWKRQSLYV